MLRKLPLTLALAFFAVGSYGQTIVSTSPENKNVVLEEFTGIHCVWCPSGHAIAKAIQDANPDRVSLINIHTGSFAVPSGSQPDFRTPWGNAIAAQSGLTGYPSGQVNRHVFPGRGMSSGSTAMGRDQWAVTANEIMATPSNVNVAVEATLDVQTRVLVVHVEAYYTGNSTESSNLLNVALLQNNTKGPQTGGGAGNNYNHMHRLVDLLTGQWGETISTVSAGSFVDKTYTYTIPEMYNNVPAVVEDMEIVAFISETHQEIPSGARTLPNFTGIVNANDATVASIEPIAPICMETIAPTFKLKNNGQNPITALTITYKINGVTHTYDWTGNLEALRNEDVQLPATAFTLQQTNTLEISVPNDDDNSNNSQTITFDKAVDATGTIDVEIKTDQYGNEFSWDIKDSNGVVIDSGRNLGINKTINVRINLDEDCYTISAYDSFGDGGCRMTVKDTDGTVILTAVGNWGSEKSAAFHSNGILSVGQSQLDNVSIFPNPAQDILNISNAESANIIVFDLLGRNVISRSNISMNEEINVSALNAGAYFVQISKDGNVTTKKFIVTK